MILHTRSYPLDAALEILKPHLASSDEKNALVAAKLVGLMTGYDQKWLDAPFLIDDVECVVSATVFNPETNKQSRTFRSGGKLDVRARERSTGSRVLFDHKSASQDIADPNGPYWRQLAIEGQVSHYMLLEWQNGIKVDYGIWDVMRKPSISPKLIAKKDRGEILASGWYLDYELSVLDREQFEASERETLLMYAARLAYDCIRDRPEWYFQRRQVPRLDGEIHEYATELWGHGQDIIQARASGRHLRNSGACMNYGRPCTYLGICSGHDTVDSQNWATKAYVHNELPSPADGSDGKDLLTNSRIRTFQTCRRKHFYQYEMGIERIDEEEREALWFGTLFHEALEQYFLGLKRLQSGV